MHRAVSILNPVRIKPAGERRFAVHGTPTDCVVLALAKLMKDHPPDLVVSGINRGPNVGDDVLYSGTTAAAVEAVINGVRAISWSQATTGRGTDMHALAEGYTTLSPIQFRGCPPDALTALAKVFPDGTRIT